MSMRNIIAVQRNLEDLGITGEMRQSDNDITVAPVRQCKWGFYSLQWICKVIDDTSGPGCDGFDCTIALLLVEREIEGRNCHGAFGVHVLFGEDDRETMEILAALREAEFCNNELVTSVYEHRTALTNLSYQPKRHPVLREYRKSLSTFASPPVQYQFELVWS